MTSPVEIGSLIAGKYRVERVLGQGGMGVVVVAMHDELDQRVAIKFLLKEALNDADWVARFAREARAAARIKSEHAVKVYDVGKLESGAPYMVMEYLEGRDLQTILNERTRIPVSEAIEYLLQACEAIAEAHGAGIVHRDLKPANLFVTHRTDGSTCVKILDFGISKVTPLTGGTREQTVTNTTAIVGSPLYMSPEQMKASKNVDLRTDIWSIGVILQELVSGMPSFVAQTTAELCALVLTAPPTPLRETLSNAPAGLDAIIERCLRKNPNERFATVGHLANALEPYGPPSVKTSVERIIRVTTGKKLPAVKEADPEPAPVSIVAVGQSRADVSSLGQTEMSDSGAPQAMGEVKATAAGIAAQQAPGAGTAAAWGSSQAVPRKSRMPLFIGAGAASALLILGVIVVAVSSSHKETGPVSTAKTAAASITVATVATATTPVATATSAAAVTSAVTTAATPAVTATMDLTTTQATATTTSHATFTSTTRPTATTKPSATASSQKPNVAPINTTGFGGRN